ncbi:MAG TPA: TetR family transcriptional regulator [Rhizomicrobium sp.]|jgi:localization factor PodJL|nr:TetR family transcriptional regulator [Rhizomicrobium sp.]
MAEGAVQNKAANDGAQDRADTRATILGAARAVAEREGVENLTLGKVAAETGLQRSMVYRQFARKEDLLMSIVSEDLAALARNLTGIDWPTSGDTPETAVILSMPRSAEPVATDVPKTVEESAPAAVEPPAPRQRLMRRTDLAQLNEPKPSPEEPDAKAAETSRTPDAWLERRLRTFERSVSGLESRQDQVEKNARASAVTAEEAIKAMQATIQELKDRADAAEARHKASATEVRTALNETNLRLQTVEGVARAALAENAPAQAPVAAVPEVAQPAVEIEALPASAASEVVPADTAPKSFIAGVRQNVVAASAAAAAQAEAEVAVKAKKGRYSLTRYLLSGLVVMTLFIAAAGVAFSKGVDDGRRDALAHRAPFAALLPATHATSLDQLTARARAGDPAAELQIGLRYLNAPSKDAAAAFHWTTLAAIHGQPVAQYLLGTFYAQGSGTTADPAKALQWFEAAALQGNRKAMHALAISYAEGLGTQKSPSEAVRWFSRAASVGYVDSEFNLAVLYEQGAGVPQSLLDAYKWYAVAGRQGDAEAKSRIEALRTQLSGDDLAAAQHAADAFRTMPLDAAANIVPS